MNSYLSNFATKKKLRKNKSLLKTIINKFISYFLNKYN